MTDADHGDPAPHLDRLGVGRVRQASGVDELARGDELLGDTAGGTVLLVGVLLGVLLAGVLVRLGCHS